MPMPPSVRYRVTRGGVRLAYKGNTVIEAKRMDPAPVRELRGQRRKSVRRRAPKVDRNLTL